MSERLKEHAWKACVRQKRTEGSNPSLSAIFTIQEFPPSHTCRNSLRCQGLRIQLIAGSCATEGYEPRQVRKEAAAVIDSVCRGGAQLSVVSVKSRTVRPPCTTGYHENVDEYRSRGPCFGTAVHSSRGYNLCSMAPFPVPSPVSPVRLISRVVSCTSAKVAAADLQ